MNNIKMISIPSAEYDKLIALSGETNCCMRCETYAKEIERLRELEGRYKEALEKIGCNGTVLEGYRVCNGCLEKEGLANVALEGTGER